MLLTWANSQGANALLNSAEFIAGFADKGSGEVDLTLARGTGSATFTRATTATTVNSAGLIVSVASGTPRSYYDPITLKYQGYLAEGARTNLCLQSADFGTTWTTSNVTVSANTITSPDGGSNADSILEAATTSTHFINQAITISASTTYTSSVFVKGLNRTWCAVEMIGVDAAGRFAYFNLSGAGSVGTTSGTTSASIVAYPNGWYRCTIVAASGTGAGTGAFRVYSASADNTATFLGNVSNGIYAWGAQLEAGAFASSYIPTTTASVTRNADVLTYPSSGNISGTSGTLYAECLFSAMYSYNTIAAGSTGNRYFISVDTNGAVFSYDGITAPSQAFSVTANALRKHGISWGSGRIYAYNGSTSSKAFDGDFDIGPAINIGFEAASTNPMFGTIRNVRIFQSQLSFGQLSGITA